MCDRLNDKFACGNDAVLSSCTQMLVNVKKIVHPFARVRYTCTNTNNYILPFLPIKLLTVATDLPSVCVIYIGHVIGN